MYTHIFISGSLAFDNIMTTEQNFDESLGLNAAFTVAQRRVYFGGTAGNIAYNLNLVEQDGRIYSSVGQDGDEYLKRISEWGFSTTHIYYDEETDTAVADILSDPHHNQITFFYPGAMASGIDAINLDQFTSAIFLIAPDDKNKMIRYADECTKHGLDYIFDPGQAMGLFSQSELRQCISNALLVITNEHESQLLQEKMGMDIEALLELCPRIITTLGDKGSVIYQHNKNEIAVPVYSPRQSVNSTGCGDAYRAGILTGLKEGWDLEKTARLASLMGAYCMEAAGTQNHEFTIDELEERLGEKLY